MTVQCGMMPICAYDKHPWGANTKNMTFRASDIAGMNSWTQN